MVVERNSQSTSYLDRTLKRKQIESYREHFLFIGTDKLNDILSYAGLLKLPIAWVRKYVSKGMHV